MFEVDHGKFEEGRAAYARGASVLGLMEAVEREHKAYEARDAENWQDHEKAGKSLMLGFMDGVIGDIRKIAGALGTVRRGTTA
jgi:hypothetical protein